MVSFEDQSFGRPLIDTYEYIGIEDVGSSAEAFDCEYVFRIVASDGDRVALTAQQTRQMLDIGELIAKLEAFRNGEIN
jgi:hypothetical protein